MELGNKKGQTNPGVGTGPEGIQEPQRLGLGEGSQASCSMQCSRWKLSAHPPKSLPWTGPSASLHDTAIFLV